MTSAETAHFPDVEGRALNGATYRLPSDLPAPRTLCVIAFRQMHQACVDRWITWAEEAGIPGSPLDITNGTDTCVVELPVISTRWRLGRRFIDGGMATSIKVPRVLARTITVYTDVERFQRALQIRDSSDVQAMVINLEGTVLARSNGEPSVTKWVTLQSALADS